MACFICLGVVNSFCGELKYANFSEINSNYSLPPTRVCVIWNLTIAYGPFDMLITLGEGNFILICTI